MLNKISSVSLTVGLACLLINTPVFSNAVYPTVTCPEPSTFVGHPNGSGECSFTSESGTPSESWTSLGVTESCTIEGLKYFDISGGGPGGPVYCMYRYETTKVEVDMVQNNYPYYCSNYSVQPTIPCPENASKTGQGGYNCMVYSYPDKLTCKGL